jgi:outer membrane protein assembly factor BamD
MFFRLAVALCIMALASSCSLFSKEIKTPPETLFKQGETLYAKKKYAAAAEKWRTVKEKTTSKLLRTAVEIRLADALFYDENYIEAAAEYENFRKLHPKNQKAPYALYMYGLSSYNQSEKIDTDQTPVKTAVTVFESFLQEYPNSELTKQVRDKLAECRAKQAAHEIYVGRFYYRTDKYGAAIGRFKEAVDKYPGVPVNDEALYLLGNAYLRTGEKVMAKEALARLVKEYPKSAFVDKAKKLLGGIS